MRNSADAVTDRSLSMSPGQDCASLIGESLRLPYTAIARAISERLARLFPDKALVEADAGSFDLMQFVEDGRAEVRPKAEEIYNQIRTRYLGPGEGIGYRFTNVWLETEWEGQTLDILLVSWPTVGYGEGRYVYLLASLRAVAERFFEAVCEWAAEVRGEVLVFDAGEWNKSRELFQAIQGTTLENLVLEGNLKQEIAGDVARFLASREQYERFGIPWKRGILLLGPPGNGKTHCVKALINASRVPCLYVKSFLSDHATDQENIRDVFRRARQTIPCILVLEDLDSLLNAENRSFFLNELDGFASNAGILTLATTNHPDRLDPAIIDRPSRFDRKYHFELPAEAERQTYLRLWNGTLLPELRLSEAGVAEIATLTDAFSFAYLKELFVSSLMQWINAAPEGGDPVAPMDRVMREQVSLLREQMGTLAESIAGVAADSKESANYRAAAPGMRR